MTIVANRISQRRRQLKMSQEELAFSVGTSQTQISRYERGENDPTAEFLTKLAIELNTTTDWLLGLTQYPERTMRGQGDLDADEVEILKLLRKQTHDQRERVINAIRALSH